VEAALEKIAGGTKRIGDKAVSSFAAAWARAGKTKEPSSPLEEQKGKKYLPKEKK
jgi:hypothetical protein|tara:strand:+ start:651 stop:815 length:165 start_codon:yes stop_codon:yes gene_type:complete